MLNLHNYNFRFNSVTFHFKKRLRMLHRNGKATAVATQLTMVTTLKNNMVRYENIFRYNTKKSITVKVL